jgi:1-acyl-sn-glycerol-3-phosphate acyltransferase
MLKRMPGIIAWTENWYRLGMFRTLLVWTLLPLFVLLLVILITPPMVLSLGLLRWPLVRPASRLLGSVGLWLAGIRVEASGLSQLEEARPRVLLINHSSMLDFLIVAWLSPPKMLTVTKSSLRWLPPVNFALWLVGNIFVDRSCSGTSLEQFKKAAHEIRRSNRSLIMAPEGTRTRTGELGAFKTGAVHLSQQAIAEIVPVVIHGAHELCPPTGMGIRSGIIRVEIKQPIPAPPADADVGEVTADVEALYRGWLGA